LYAGFSPVAPGQSSDIQPERSINYELGTRAQWQGGQAEAVGFFNDYKNLTGQCSFSAGCDDSQTGEQFNAGAVYIAGFEGLVKHRQQWKPKFWTEVAGSYTFTWSRFRTSFLSSHPQLGDVTRGDELPYVPKHQASLQLGLGGRIWAVNAMGGYVGKMRDTSGQGKIPADEVIGDQLVFDLSGRVWATKRASFYTTFNNVTASRYMISRRPFGARPGRPFSFMVGFTYEFG
jgi:Fe(3+) dicitrate transport protein